jgi:hypothetical protein
LGWNRRLKGRGVSGSGILKKGWVMTLHLWSPGWKTCR